MFSIFIGIYSPEENPGFPEWDEPRARRRSDSRLGNFVHSTAVGRLGISDGAWVLWGDPTESSQSYLALNCSEGLQMALANDFAG